jgi:hypothetical protein
MVLVVDMVFSLLASMIGASFQNKTIPNLFPETAETPEIFRQLSPPIAGILAVS